MLLDLIRLPESMQITWSWFIDLHNSRTSTGYGINPITYSCINGYFSVFGITPDEWQIRAIKQLDTVAINSFVEDQKKQNKTKQSK